MDFFSHAVLGAFTAVCLTGQKSHTIALEGAIMGTIPDFLGGPVIEGYHLVKCRFKVFSKIAFFQTFLTDTPQRWDRSPAWILDYYNFLHSIWFTLLFTGIVYDLNPACWWWGPTLFLSHILVDLFLHKDSPEQKHARAIRPFWPARFSIQVVQWSNIFLWVRVPVIPLLLQALFWWWYLSN